ncbi:MAG: hypothetical protein CUN52_00135 [Phototrophicales bacterium]|nr:MAG: hypothetical protein CUN52_00135 [Phototrophicales bacterium]
MFGDFLEALAIFIASKTYGGYKSTFAGVDLEFIKSDTHYLVQIKSGINTLTTLFVQHFCLPDGAINWEKLLQLNSQNLDTPN